MFKERKKRITAIFLCLIIGLSVGLCVYGQGFVSDWLEQQNNLAYELAVRKLLMEVSFEMKGLRGFDPGNVNLTIVTIQWLKDNWGKDYTADQEKIGIEERIYRSLFIIPQDGNLTKIVIDQQGCIAAAASLLSSDLYVVKEYFHPEEPEAKGILVHELTHIIQGRYLIGANDLFMLAIAYFDERQAYDSLLEGDAMLSEWTHMGNPEVNLDNWQLPELPEAYAKIMLFPYVYGKSFVLTTFKQGGWDMVNELYKKPPTTTEQIMHPEKYLNNEVQLQTETLRDFDMSWVRKRTDTLGEYFTYLMLSSYLNKQEALKAAAGWGGDSLAYYERDGKYLISWNIVWDTGEDAGQFSDAVGMMLQNGAWNAAGTYFDFEMQGNSTLIVISTDPSF